jgi:6-phosphofructokinase 1
LYSNPNSDPGADVRRQETDWHRRRPKNEFWMNLKQIVNILSGRPEQVPNAKTDVQNMSGKPKQ